METRRLDALTGLRFFAALWVMLFHYREITPSFTYEVPLFDTWLKWGGMGVELFFVLSGFIMSYVYSATFNADIKRKDYGTFIIYRIARLYPIHLLTFLGLMTLYGVALLFGAVEHPERFTGLMVISTLTMTHSWFPGVLTPNQPAWSVSAEFFAYLLFPVLCLSLHKRRWVPWVFFVIGLLLSAVSDSQILLRHIWAINDGIIRVSAGFMIGMVAYCFRKPLTHRIASPWTGWICCGIAVIWLGVSTNPARPVGILIFSILILSLTTTQDKLGSLLSHRRIVYLGEVSFSIYMIHWIIRILGREALSETNMENSLHPLAIIAIWSLVTIFVAAFCHRYIETPGREVIRNLSTWRIRRPAVAKP